MHMKSLIKTIALSTCTLFTLFMVVNVLIALPFAGLQYGLVITLSLLVAALAFSLLRALWFTDRVIRRLAYPARILGFGLTAFVVLAAIAWVGAWFPVDEPGAWLSFAGIYLVVLAAFCIAYQIHFKRTVGSFDAALRAYQERITPPSP